MTASHGQHKSVNFSMNNSLFHLFFGLSLPTDVGNKPGLEEERTLVVLIVRVVFLVICIVNLGEV